MAETPKHDYGEFAEFYSEFRGESDRAAVILGAARLEILLDQLLRMHLLPNVGSEDELFDGDAPLGTFHAKTLLAYRLGLIDTKLVRALTLTRKIRNAFAHEGAGCDLNKGSNRDRVKELRKNFGNDTEFDGTKEEFFEDKPGTSSDFRTALTVIAVRLEGAVKNIKQIDSRNPYSLVPPSWEEKK